MTADGVEQILLPEMTFQLAEELRVLVTRLISPSSSSVTFGSEAATQGSKELEFPTLGSFRPFRGLKY